MMGSVKKLMVFILRGVLSKVKGEKIMKDTVKEHLYDFLKVEITRLKSTKDKWLAIENMGEDKFSELGWKCIISMINKIYKKIALTEQLLNHLRRMIMCPDEKDDVISKTSEALRKFYEEEARLEISIKINMVNKLKGVISE